MTKLNDKRIKWLCKQVVNEGRKPKDLAPVYGYKSNLIIKLGKNDKQLKERIVYARSCNAGTSWSRVYEKN